MQSRLSYVLAAVGLVWATGCAANPIVGHGVSQVGRYRGDVGITGNGTELTIQSGSEVPKLSIAGDACIVNVEDGAIVRRIEFWGSANTVTIPDNLEPMVASMGTNKVVRRPVGQPPSTQPTAATRPADK
jgi:hypothetical protein